MRKASLFLFFLSVLCVGCNWQLPHNNGDEKDINIEIERFDRIEHLFLTSGDFAALQQMKTNYPAETRTLIEDVLHLGMADEPDINTRFLMFFQDSTLQTLISDVDKQYGDVSDLESDFTDAFVRLKKMLPDIDVPRIYAQISSLDQSVVVGDSLVGISLDKYLGSNHPVYLKYGYTDRQRSMMTRSYIVPDCLGFYLLGHYPMPTETDSITPANDAHMARIQYVVNKAMGQKFFKRDAVMQVDSFMKANPDYDINTLLSE